MNHNEVVSHTEGVEDGSNQNSPTENVRPQQTFHSEMNMSHTPSVTQNGSYRDVSSSSGATNCRNDTAQTTATRVTRNTGSVSRNSSSYMRENNEADDGDDTDDDDDGFVSLLKREQSSIT